MRQPFKTIYGVLMPVADVKPLASTAEAQMRRERREPQRKMILLFSSPSSSSSALSGPLR